MPFSTPRGLKIRLTPQWAFSLIARLHSRDPRTDAYRVLKTAEIIEVIPSVSAVLAGLVAVFVPAFLDLDLKSRIALIPAAITLGRIFGFLLAHYGVFFILKPLGLMRLARAWNRIPLSPGLVVHVPLVVLFYLTFEWQVASFWILGHAFAFFLCAILSLVLMMRMSKSVGMLLTSSELSFFHAYRIHAALLDVTTDIALSKAESQSDSWRAPFDAYSRQFPQAVVDPQGRHDGLSRHSPAKPDPPAKK